MDDPSVTTTQTRRWMLPADPSEDDLARHWSLTPADLAAIAHCRGPDQRRRFALQLCVMRLRGRFLDDYRQAPIKIVNHLSRQLGLPPVLFLDRAGREPTERVQAQRIRRYLALSRFDKAAEASLRDWLREGALEGRSAAELLARAEDKLRGWRVMLPATGTPDQVLSRIDRDADYGALQPLLRGRINVALIGEQWDQLVRLAASLKDRLTPAHVVMQRLANANASDRLAGALTQLGRPTKTIHVLRYIHEAPLRDAIQLQLNRGEFRHILAKSLFFANQGGFRSGDYEEVMNKAKPSGLRRASCLSLLSNAVLVWNTVHIARIVDQLRAAGHEVLDEDLARVSPLAHAHVIPNGSYFQSPRRRAAAAPEPVLA